MVNPIYNFFGNCVISSQNTHPIVEIGLCVSMEQNHATSISGHQTTQNGSFMSTNIIKLPLK